jgi:hypothetical protein
MIFAGAQLARMTQARITITDNVLIFYLHISKSGAPFCAQRTAEFCGSGEGSVTHAVISLAIGAYAQPSFLHAPECQYLQFVLYMPPGSTEIGEQKLLI